MLRTSILFTLLLIISANSTFAQDYINEFPADMPKEEMAAMVAENQVVAANRALIEQRQLRNLSRMLEQFQNDEESLEFLNLLDFQREKIDIAKKKYEADLEELEKAIKDAGQEVFFGTKMQEFTNERIRLRQKYRQRLKDALLDHQLEMIEAFDLGNVGVAKAVTESDMSEVLGLTEQQKQRIRRESDRLALRIHDFVHQSRQDSFEAIMDELSDEQTKKLEKFYGKEKLKSYFESSHLETIFQHHLYDIRNIPNADRVEQPSHLLLRTDLGKRER